MEQNRSKGPLRWLLGEGLSQGLQAAFQNAWTYAAPFVAAAMAFASRWLSEPLIPWPYIITATFVSFAAVASGLLRFSQWRAANDPKHKLQFAGVTLTVRKNSPDLPFEGLGLGFNVHNTATFPIEFYIESIRSVLDARVNPKPTYKNRTFLVDAGATLTFYDDKIPIKQGDIASSPLSGSLRFVLNYGRPGRLRFTLAKSLEVHVGIDSNGNPAGANWMETPDQ